MEEVFTSEEQISTGKIYKDKAIYVATFLGGPLVAGYLIANNFKVFNDQGKVKKTWVYTIIATIIIFTGAYYLSDFDKVPNQLLPLIYTAIAYYLVKSYQGEKINSFIDSGGLAYGWWRTILISIIGLIITAIPIFLVVLLTSSAASTSKVYRNVQSYGDVKNEIYFNNKTISITEVNKIADALTKTEFFNEEQKKSVYVKEIGNDYDITIGINNLNNKKQVFTAFIAFRNQLQGLLPNHKIIIVLVQNSLDNEIKRFE